MNSKLLFITMVAGLTLVSCSKKVETKTVEVPVYISKEEVPVKDDTPVKDETPKQDETPSVPNTGVVRTDSAITYKKNMRKTDLEFNVSGEISNMEQFLVDFNKRKIIAINEGRALDHGELRCSDATDPTNVKSMKIGFTNDGTRAELVVALPATNSGQIKYSCGVYEGNVFVDKSNTEFEFFPDKLISVPTKYNDLGISSKLLKKFGAIVLLEHGSIVSDGQNLQIQAEEMVVAPGGKIQTFLENESTAADNMPGRSGGFIDMKTDFIAGKLKVEMHGMNAGKVTAVPEKVTTYPAFYTPGMLDGVVEITHTQRAHEPDIYGGYGWEEAVDVPATSGRDGFKGQIGLKGAPGLRGGDSGVFKLTTTNSPNTFSIDVELMTGKKGAGGMGGAGGPGVPGGNISCKVQCYGVTKGKDGAVGDQGPQGDSGDDGKLQYSYFFNIKDPMQNRDFNTEAVGV